MGQLTLMVNGQSYTLACRDGEEAQLVRLAAYVDEKVSDLVGRVGQIGEARLLLMTALLIADELQELRHGQGLVSKEDADAAIDQAARRVMALVERLPATP